MCRRRALNRAKRRKREKAAVNRLGAAPSSSVVDSETRHQNFFSLVLFTRHAQRRAVHDARRPSFTRPEETLHTAPCCCGLWRSQRQGDGEGSSGSSADIGVAPRSTSSSSSSSPSSARPRLLLLLHCPRTNSSAASLRALQESPGRHRPPPELPSAPKSLLRPSRCSPRSV